MFSKVICYKIIIKHNFTKDEELDDRYIDEKKK